jgi:hypothetical protein
LRTDAPSGFDVGLSLTHGDRRMDRLRLAATAAFSAALIAGASLAQTPPPAPPPTPAPAPTPDAAQTPPTPPAPEAPPAPPPPPPPPPLKPLPTDPEAVRVLDILDRVCAPLVRGGAVKTIAQTVGLRVNGDGDMILGQDGGRRMIIHPPTTANPNNCSITVRYVAGEEGAIRDGLEAWSQRRDPMLGPDKVAVQSPEDGGVSVTSTWLGYANGKEEGVVLILHNKADGTPQNGHIGEAQILYSYRSY